MLYVAISATFSENISSLSVKDTDAELADYALEVVCTNCREKNDSRVTVNRLEKHEMSGSRGEASFVMKCKFCGSECSINLEKTEEKLYNLEIEENTEAVQKVKVQRKKQGIKKVEASQAILLALDCRGCEVINLAYTNLIFEVQLTSGSTMEASFEDENEWYDYDDKASEEASIVDLKFEVVKGK
ncbi:LANO_0A00826g1_1 [Lachancea nothofagi CBS 11611]|uniref:LANO_0A00826g1_1 n=1 Tax=Lachancea nothofagi CBS 11611 TaxID=1266666 RepID=A0A1G4IMF2_9SACH|nr:LANO_0A00826g1_1 [Lachancea nothofagi CBS 11611]